MNVRCTLRVEQMRPGCRLAYVIIRPVRGFTLGTRNRPHRLGKTDGGVGNWLMPILEVVPVLDDCPRP